MTNSTPSVTLVSLSGDLILNIAVDSGWRGLNILDELRQVGEHRICSLIYGTVTLEPSASLESLKEAGFCDGNNQLTAMFWTASGLQNVGHSVNSLMGTDTASKDLRAKCNLKVQNAYTGQELRASGFTVQQLSDAGCSLYILRDAGYTVRECRNAGYTLKTLMHARFPLSSFKDAGCTPKELFELGFTIEFFRDAGYDLVDLRGLICCTARQVKSSGYTLAQVKAAGYTAGQLKVAGFSLDQIKGAGYTLVELKEAGYAVWVLAASGYGIKELRRGGFSDLDLSQAGLISVLPVKDGHKGGS